MIFSYNWLQSFFKRKLPKPEELAEFLILHFVEVEESRKEEKDYILDIDVRPNRAADCFSHSGIARECAALTISNFQFPISNFKEDKKLQTKDLVSVEVKDKIACPRYTARVIADVKVGPSPKWIQERLKTCGLRPINNIVDIANYVMLETGQPLHAFDYNKLEADKGGLRATCRPPAFGRHLQSGLRRKIIIRKAKKNEKIITLDNEKYNLDEDILVIADSKEPIAIAGIKGGEKAEIGSKTKIVVLESANFNPKIIRRGSKKLGLKTDSSLRFEHGIDSNLTELAINRAAYLIQKISNGKVAQGLIDFYPKKVLSKQIKLDLNYVENLLGVKIPEKEIKNILKRLGFKLMEVGPPLIEVEVPTFRLDVSLPEDLIEEIGRIYGYQRIPSAFPIATLIPPKRNLEIFWEDFSKNILKEAGFTEVYNYSFISERDISIFQPNQDKSTVLEIENPTSIDFKYLRPSLIPNLLKNIQKNQKNFKEIKIFELGKVFQAPKIEKRILTGAMTGEGFYQLKGVVDLLLTKLGITNIWYDNYQPTPEQSKISIWHSKKRAEIKVNHQEIGFLGEISRPILENFKIEPKVVIFELDFEKLSKLCSEEHQFQPLSYYPAATRDLAILVPSGVLVEEVLNIIENVGGKLVRDVDLFDIYEGEELPEGKKNLAFHIIYQAEDRTLTAEEIDEIQNRIIKALEEKSEWEVRR